MKFSDTRVSDNEKYQPEIRKDATGEPIYVDGKPQYVGDDLTYYNWKRKHIKNRTRNNGNSHNKLALASGVYLELTTEKSTGPGLYEKDWGPITGVVELDLINVAPGIGGGFVYAKNQHGEPDPQTRGNTTLTALNKDAATQWDYEYATADVSKHEWETSGNFVHSTQTIIDDCYNVSNRYTGTDAMPAHYWYIKGSVYVYDQYISAYTGLPNAFSETVDIPLTISAASHGTMKLMNIQPSLYAYYSAPGMPLDVGKKLIINDKTYYKNDPISYWDWYLLSSYERSLFVPETRVNSATCTIDGTEWEAGTYVMNENDYAKYKQTSHTYTNAAGEILKDGDEVLGDDDIFRSSNIVSHGTGYILTYEVNNPEKWDTWYTKYESATHEKNQTGGTGYNDGPTYSIDPETLEDGENGKLLGQRDYEVGDIISDKVESTYKTIVNKPATGQAKFKEAYIVTEEATIPDGTGTRHLYVGAIVSDSVKNANSGLKTEKAYICTNTIKLGTNDYIYVDTKLKESEKTTYLNGVYTDIRKILTGKTDEQLEVLKRVEDLTTTEQEALTNDQKTQLKALIALKEDILNNIVAAYYCTQAGLYGGNFYQKGKNYRGLETWSTLSADDREYFTFNYDALDLLIDPNYAGNEGKKYQYDGQFETEEAVKDTLNGGNKAGYSVTQSVDYTASYTGEGFTLETGQTVTVKRLNTTSNEYENKVITGGKTGDDGKVKNGDELSRDDFESLTNEKRHYAPIVVKDEKTYYVVNTAFQIGSTPYAVGNTMSSAAYNGLPESEQSNVTVLTFQGASSSEVIYYYCRESYAKGNSTITPITSSSGTVTTTEGGSLGGITNGNVEVGTLISSGEYDVLKNQQADFTIHGISPTETSTLFVSRESDIHDLSKEKIITVVYKYDYEESDSYGNVSPVSERHVVNIHLVFKSGVPTVADISKPGIILPGDYVSLSTPEVIPGASDISGSGWELYATPRDAETHTNSIPYNPDKDPLYLFQHDWYVAYYAKSVQTGKTYSNHVQVSVANYHDLKKVMDAKEHHYYIDNPNVYREPKIYINDYSESNENGLDLFKQLYDLSVYDDNTNVDNDIITEADSPLKDHHTLDKRVRAGRNLEFFLRTDIDHSGSAWTPIGSNNVSDNPTTTDVDEATSGTPKGDCFDGVLHGDGHTISGLDHSLFAHLCGEVYNLGVTGSFTGAGVADEGDGYVESCWINTTGTPDGTAYPVFGDPSDSGHEQTVNCYYQEGKGYKDGKAIAKPDRAFYNGEVAYDLNNFYLYKRYNDNAKPTSSNKLSYKYWKKTGEEEPLTGTYIGNAAWCSSGYNNLKYVEDRFADGDFIYDAGDHGYIPTTTNERCYMETVTDNGVTETKPRWYPIWPDDYLFFGQALNYNHVEGLSHQNTPSSIIRDETGRVLADVDDYGNHGNRVYRAPAYFRSKEMGVAYFNKNAVFAQSNAKLKTDYRDTVAYRNMTAIDFTGNNGDVAGGYKLGSSNDGKFYAPLLDEDGLNSFLNFDLTQNLLVYTEKTGQTADVVSGYLYEPIYTELDDNYRTVLKQENTTINGIHGHWVAGTTATKDHLLVDKQDFNAPISYSFAEGQRMWYQRTPDRYIDIAWSNDATPVRSTTGWEDVSLPFKAELVTTNEKGEITHFYDGSDNSDHNTKLGHEYWLREFKTGGTTTGDNIYTANFTYPDANSTDGQKKFANTFLWDYYYQYNEFRDQKGDLYQEDDANRYYYKKGHIYDNYPRLAADKPYIIGFPGKRYYEFDLSGQFWAATAANKQPYQLDAQTITFASKPGATIRVTDDYDDGITVDGYTFKPNFLNESFTAGTGTTPTYTLNGDGNSYDLVTGTEPPVVTYAFRPYFVKTSSSRQTRSIIFSNNGLEQLSPDSHVVEPGILEIHAVGHNIVVTSSLKFTTDVRILNTAGLTMKTFAIRPGETIETRIFNAGVYIVQDEEGKYTKKLSVK